MQILEAAGFPPIGDAFPKDWGDTPLREANPAGFYESSFRNGIHHATNPVPGTEHYVTPEGTERMAVKIFPAGFVRTHRAFIDRVIVTLRPWREYVASRARLLDLDRQSQVARGKELAPRTYLPAAYEWWLENVMLLNDLGMRRFDARWVAYDALLADPERHVGNTVGWLGGDIAAGCAIVDRSLRTQSASKQDHDIPENMAAVCDAWCEGVATGGLELPLRRRIVAMHRQMQPTLQGAIETQRAEDKRWREAMRERS